MWSKREQLLCRLPSTGRLVLSAYSMSECGCVRLLIGRSREQMKTSPVSIPFSWPSFFAIPLFLIILYTLHRPLDLKWTFGGYNYGNPFLGSREQSHVASHPWPSGVYSFQVPRKGKAAWASPIETPRLLSPQSWPRNGGFWSIREQFWIYNLTPRG